jgi:hypothetical protein
VGRCLRPPQVYYDHKGKLRGIHKALKRGKHIQCARCNGKGATLGCREPSCPNGYHLPCAHLARVQFLHHDFLIACPEHASHKRHRGAAEDAVQRHSHFLPKVR